MRGLRRGRIFAAGLAITMAFGMARAQEGNGVKGAETAAIKGKNDHYVGNRAPLTGLALIKLPIGAIRPEGWLRYQLQAMADGFTGHLPEVSPWTQFKGNAWTSASGQGKYGWEEVPYWLKGYVDLGYVLQDRRIIDEAEQWVGAIMASQRPDGYFGPESNRETPDLWPNMLALYAVRSHYEATGDKRVLPFMTKYFRWVSALPLDRFLPNDWQKWRGGDQLDSIYWLYNRTGEKWLLDLARVNHERTADWVGGIPTWHGVNLCQGFREPAEYYQQTGDARYLKSTERDFDLVMSQYGQVPGGMFGADENARPGYGGPRQAAETCSMVEMMFSSEMLCGITGETKWADHCEDVAFNSLPASMTPDLKGLHYLTAPNMIQLDRQSKSPMLQNGGDMLSYNPHDYRCCQHNVAFGWPYFAEHLFMATPGNGLAAMLYAPSRVTAKVGGGTTVTIEEKTDYPFDETVEFAISAPEAVRFPFRLRVPGWCSGPKMSVNGAALDGAKLQAGWIVLDREWKSGDTVRLTLPMKLAAKVWEKNRDSVSVSRGPLTYSLKIGERWQAYGEESKWPGYEVFPTTPWNYGLIVDPENPDQSFTVVKQDAPLAEQPFTLENAPITLCAKARRIPEWTQEANGLIGEVQQSPVKSDQPVEEVTLVPMGCARLRVSAFPRIGDGLGAHEWADTAATITASHVHDLPMALNDGVMPRSSADLHVPRFTWWDHVGTTEWVQYTFPKPHRISSSEVYWFDDEPSGGQCRVPSSWQIEWWDGAAWKPVPGASAYGTAKDRLNRVRFAPVETTMVRLVARLQVGYSGGVMEWRVGE